MRRLPLESEASGIAPRPSSDVWALSPTELVARGISSGEATFGCLQRPWRWRDGRPDLAPRWHSTIEAIGAQLPVIERIERSGDGAAKVLLRTGADLVEAVHMPRSVVSGNRVTLCVSSQVGCAIGCSFCATASMGFIRHLSAGEIVGQILVILNTLGPRHPGELTLVFMGMGEPLHNLAAVARAIEILSTSAGLGVAPRRITVSTSGLVPQIEQLGGLARRPLLAISLNATQDEQRQALMPINRRYPLAQLRSALERYPLRPRERITVEYVLLAGVNDSLEDARRLLSFCAGFRHVINVIPFNAHPHAPYRAPSEAQLEAFTQVLLDGARGMVTVRRSRGRDVNGACGQLVQSL